MDKHHIFRVFPLTIRRLSNSKRMQIMFSPLAIEYQLIDKLSATVMEGGLSRKSIGTGVFKIAAFALSQLDFLVSRPSPERRINIVLLPG